MRFERVLALAPHTDDAELGAGGTLARLAEEGSEIRVVVFSTAEDSLPDASPPGELRREFLEAAPHLGVPPANLVVHDFPVRQLAGYRQEVLDSIVDIGRAFAPDLVLVPSSSDLHQDHQTVYAEGLRFFKATTVMGYELPWNHISFSAQAFFVLEEHHIERKWQALQCYRTQLILHRPYFSLDFITGLARVRGVQVKADYAEAYELLRIKL